MSDRVNTDRRRILQGVLAATLFGAGARAATPSKIDVAQILRQRVDIEKRTVGIAAAVVTYHGIRIICYGRERLDSDRKVSGETLFEIASITKIYTALLLAELARDGVLAIDDPAAKHLPADFVLPARDGRGITLADLATHTSGLPRMPWTNWSQQTASYSVADLKAWLGAFKLARTPGSGWEYSNLGYALLGLALSHRADRPYGELLKRRILDPLGLASTFVHPPVGTAVRVAEGHDAKLKPIPASGDGIFAPAGALLSTAEDLGHFVRAVMPGSGSPLEPSARRLLQTRRPALPAGGQQALGWEVLPAREGDYVSKDGVNAGQCASAVFDPSGRMGVVVLSNTFPEFRKTDTSPSGGGVGAADVARHVLRPSIPLGAYCENAVMKISRRDLLNFASAPAAIALASAARAAPRPIAESGFVPIGGIEQWIAIRGRDRTRPAILFLHGGAGEAQSPFLSFYGSWEEHYVVAQWDQRGSGKTFGKLGVATPDMTLRQLTLDAAEVAQYVLQRLGKRKLILIGHSWGSMLGLCVVRLRPELFHAFVGTGQVASGRELIESWRLSGLARARAAHDADAVAQLSDPHVDSDSKLALVTKWMAPFTASDQDFITRRQGPFVGTYEKPANAAAADWYKGFFEFSQPKLWSFMRDFDAGTAGYDFPVPIFVIQGRDDTRTPPAAARAFVSQVHAPAKGYTEIDGGHFAYLTNPTGFMNALNSDIRGLGIR